MAMGVRDDVVIVGVLIMAPPTSEVIRQVEGWGEFFFARA